MTDSIPADTPTLRLGVYKLPAAETALVQTLLRLYASSGACRWIYASARPTMPCWLMAPRPKARAMNWMAWPPSCCA